MIALMLSVEDGRFQWEAMMAGVLRYAAAKHSARLAAR
jgi:hypothetical protein